MIRIDLTIEEFKNLQAAVLKAAGHLALEGRSEEHLVCTQLLVNLQKNAKKQKNAKDVSNE